MPCASLMYSPSLPTRHPPRVLGQPELRRRISVRRLGHRGSKRCRMQDLIGEDSTGVKLKVGGGLHGRRRTPVAGRRRHGEPQRPCTQSRWWQRRSLGPQLSLDAAALNALVWFSLLMQYRHRLCHRAQRHIVHETSPASAVAVLARAVDEAPFRQDWKLTVLDELRAWAYVRVSVFVCVWARVWAHSCIYERALMLRWSDIDI